mgnify:CR=1 FL=1|jgi:Ca2+-transporting ATPase
MTVTKAYTVDHGIFDLDRGAMTLSPSDSRAPMFLIGNLCNHAHSDKGKYRGQATEVALMNVLQQVGLADQRPFFTRKSEVAFSSETKTQSVTGSFTHAQATGPDSTYLSGALDPVLARCQTYLREDNSTAPLDAGVAKLVASKAVELASLGLRVVAMAYGPDPNALTFAGFQGMMDPPRPGVADAITKLSAGGIHVVMITGDSEETAVAIARQLGIRTTPGNSNHHHNRIGVLTGKEIDALSQRQLTDRIGGVTVFARTTPRHKMAIIEAYQARGAVVAMTGDGGACRLAYEILGALPRTVELILALSTAVNDAPALRMADIGVSMGRGGTDVAKEAADVILVDDNFATLLPAVEEGKGELFLAHS